MNPLDVTKKIVGGTQPYIEAGVQETVRPISISCQKFVQKVANSTTEVLEEFLKNKATNIPTRDSSCKLYSYENVLLYKTNGQKALELEEQFRSCASNDAVPKFVTYFQMGEDDFLTIAEVSDKKLVPYWTSAGKVSSKTKLDFKSGVNELLKLGIVNREIFANKDAMLLTEDGKQIVFADWSSVNFVSGAEKQKMFEALKNWRL